MIFNNLVFPFEDKKKTLDKQYFKAYNDHSKEEDKLK